MKKFILSILLLSSIQLKANETEIPRISCWDGLYVGKTSVEVNQNNFSITQEVYENGVFSTKILGTGNIVSFYESDEITVVDFYQGLKKVGTLIAVNSGWGSRLEYKGNTLGLHLNCLIRGN